MSPRGYIKNLLNASVLTRKADSKGLIINKDGIMGIFLPLWNLPSIDQWDLALVVGDAFRCIFKTSHPASQRHLKQGRFVDLWDVLCEIFSEATLTCIWDKILDI